jgi:ATP-binding cassette subfamily A (ABC1) protein 5
VSFNLYFSSFFLVLTVVYFISYIGLLVIVLAFDVASLTMPAAFTTLAVMYLMYLPSALVYAGACSYLFDKTETARQFYPNLATTIGFVLYTAVSLVDILVEKGSTDPGLITHCVFAVTMPWYIPFGTLYYINKVYLECSLRMTCEDVTLSDYCTVEIMLMFFMNIFNAFFYYFVLRAVDALKTGGSLRDAFFLSVSRHVFSHVQVAFRTQPPFFCFYYIVLS